MTQIGTLALVFGLTHATLASAEGGVGTAQGKPWIHVEVVEEENGGENVNIDLPLSVAQLALNAAPDEFVVAAQSVFLMPFWVFDRTWDELRELGEGELLTVESEDEKVRISRHGDLLLIHVDELAQNNQVRVEIPVPVVDALTSSQRRELDFANTLAQLEDYTGDVVRVDDGRSMVRIWIDKN